MSGKMQDHDAISERAESLRPHLRGDTVVGIVLPHETMPEALGLSRVDDTDWSPFAWAGTVDTRTVLMAPDAPAGITRERVFAIRVLRALGSEILIIADRCAAIRPRFPAGSLVAIADHLNLSGTNPLLGPNDKRIGPRFPDMTSPYDLRLLEQIERMAVEEGQTIQRCVYANVGGPPTVAECRFLAYVGADVYGFGVVPDTITAIHAGLRVAAFAGVTACRIPEGPDSQETMAIDEAGLNDGVMRILMRLIRYGSWCD